MLRQKELLQAIVDNIPVMLNLIDQDGRIRWVNDEWHRVLGWTLEETQTMDVFAAAYPDPVVRRRVLAFIKTAGSGWVDYQTTRKDGTVIDTSWADLRLSDGTTIGIGQDITARKLVERELRASHEQLMRLSDRTATRVERERRTVARELHDELGQLLSVLKMDLVWLLTSVAPNRDPDVLEKIDAMSRRMDDALAAVRRISAGLRPAELDRLGLIAALQALAAQFERRSGLRCRMKTSVPSVQLGVRQAAHVYRIIQEALTNSLRHARATHLTIEISALKDALRFAVIDNGIGISPDALSDPDALGLLGMKERAVLAGGVLEIRPQQRKGTSVRVTIPCDNRTLAAEPAPFTNIVVMGAAGAGKTTVGTKLAHDLGWRFVDADGLHPRENIAKMSRHEPLTDEDREPWLQAVRQTLARARDAHESLVVACSALKRRYRHTLGDGLDDVRFVYLKATRAQLEQRLSTRTGHFAGPALLDSQLAVLEEPTEDEAMTLDASQPPDALVGQITRAFKL